MNATCHDFGGRIVTPSCSIVRWPDAVMNQRPGTYAVISTVAVLELLKLRFGYLMGGYTHPTCVVDDFGNLVRVPQ